MSAQSAPLRPKKHLPPGDVLFVTLDTLRFDAAQAAWAADETPQLARLLGKDGWELRHAPGSFTYASHQAMFAGFLPTPAEPGRHERLFALRFKGSVTAGPNTLTLDAPSLPEGFSALGYHTICIGGVGFFNLTTPLSHALPALFNESHWEPGFGVMDPDSTGKQARFAVSLADKTDLEMPLFLFMNVSALHHPNWHYGPTNRKGQNNLESHRAALGYVDGELGTLFDAMRARAERRGHPCVTVICSDHGTTYGEDGYTGHRLAHEHVWNVPYAETLLGA